MLDKTKFARVGFAFFIISGLFLLSFYKSETASLAEEMQSLGLETSPWLKENYTKEEVIQGENLVYFGSIKGSSKRISPFFVCIDCHSPVKDVAHYANPSAAENLEFTSQNNLHYLPATSFYGMINKSEFYAGDYEKKYGNLALKARHNLDEAIQLCSQECSQGRKLSDDELRYIKAYFKHKELKLDDIFETLEEKINYTYFNDTQKADFIRKNFESRSENTFVATNLNDLKTLKGDSKNGEHILKSACMSCHKNERISYYEIADTRISKNNLLKKLNNKENELLSIIRFGTQSLPGSKAYMPVYTQEKLSNQQIADLIAYLNEK